jgi:hypothetical protein|tara:strand:+ start:104 stop:427 length:324 start_codon:yes stop_codon:yes gene_type:complete
MAYKAKSITSKASSACRMNASLVAGHTATGTAKKTGMDHFQEGFEKKESPAQLAPLIAAAIPAVVGALSKGKEEKGGGGGSTKVVVNNSATANSTSNSQAANAIDPK